MRVSTIGLDLAKNVFQIHGITESGEVVFNRALRRAKVLSFFEALEPCLVGIEACGTSHHWARELIKLGHDVKLIPPTYVKPYVKRGKSDAVDAAAICEAVTRPTMRFVEVKTLEQQAILSVHRTRDLIVRQRTQTINMLRAQLAEFGVVLPQGIYHAIQYAKDCLSGEQPDLPEVAGDVIFELSDQLRFLHSKILLYSRQMNQIAKCEKRVALLRTIPGVGPITASAIVATVGSGKQFNNGREFAAWLGLTPLNRSDFTYDAQDDAYTCPGGKKLRQFRRTYKVPRSGVDKEGIMRYRAKKADCDTCGLKARCTPNAPQRKVLRSIYEPSRDIARQIYQTIDYAISCKLRKKVEMLFAHLKRILKLDRLRLRGPCGVRDEFHLAATAQNLRKLAKLIPVQSQTA